MLLVYELMPQGTLGRHLFNWEEEGLEPLEWNTRLNIALDFARGGVFTWIGTSKFYSEILNPPTFF